MMNRLVPRRRQRGTTLLEALVAFLVLALGMLSVARVQGQLRLHADVARQRSEAVRLGQEDIEALRAFSVIAASGDGRAYADIASLSTPVDSSTGYPTNTEYLVARQIEPAAVPNAKLASVTVSWTDRGGSAQQVLLSSIIAGSDPAYSAALRIARSGVPVKGALARSPRIPVTAKDLGNGSSALKPIDAGTAALLFNNQTGLVTGRCTGVDPAIATRDLSAADLGACDANVGYLLSGVVRFTAAALPAGAAPPALDIALALTGSGYPNPPVCASEALKTVSYVSAGSRHIDAVPIAAAPASLGLAAWSELGDRHVAYHCVVYPLTSGQWSGRSTVTPIGWTIGAAADDKRVCRYSADLDSSGAIDTNLEHPSSYAGVDTALARQNFLVVNGVESCPAGSPMQVEGTSSDVFANLSTVQHQP